MNRTSLHARLSLASSLFLISALFGAAPTWAQYMYLDTNGDGVHTDADVVNPAGPTNVDVWLNTNHDRDGSLQTCNSHTGAPQGSTSDSGLDFFSYDVYLVVSHGTVVWGEFEDKIGFKKLPNDEFSTRTDKQIHITRFADLGDEKPAGRYKLGSMTVTASAGTPSIFFSPMVGWDYSSFGTQCTATGEFPNSYVYGVDWFDADGALYGGTINHEPVLVQPSWMLVIENHVADQDLQATDEDGQALTFSKFSGPAYATVSTTDPGAGQAAGTIHLAPSSADVGVANLVVRASDGIFWDDKSVQLVVQRELQLNAQSDVTMYAGDTATQPLSAVNVLKEPLQFSVVSGPAFVTVDSRVYGIQTRIAPTARDIGTWTVTLAVSNGTIQDQKSFTLVVMRSPVDHPPVAVAGGPVQGIVGRPVLFDGSQSSDADGDRLSYTWMFGDGSPGATGASVEHRYTAEGDYTVDLTVRDMERFTVGTTIAHVATFAPARAFLPGGNGAMPRGATEVVVRVQPLGWSFDASSLAAAGPSSFTLTSGAGKKIAAVGWDTSGDQDADKDGKPDQGVLFAATDVAKLLEDYRGRSNADLTIRGDLSGGGRFSAPLTIQVVHHGGALFAGISPNPLNPVGQLSFVTIRPGTADVKIFDVSGRLAHHPIDHSLLPAGFHEVSVGHGSAGDALPSGIYYYRIETQEGVARGRFAIVR